MRGDGSIASSSSQTSTSSTSFSTCTPRRAVRTFSIIPAGRIGTSCGETEFTGKGPLGCGNKSPSVSGLPDDCLLTNRSMSRGAARPSSRPSFSTRSIRRSANMTTGTSSSLRPMLPDSIILVTPRTWLEPRRFFPELLPRSVRWRSDLTGDAQGISSVAGRRTCAQTARPECPVPGHGV